jgi:peptide/nickel transport system permease protein
VSLLLLARRLAALVATFIVASLAVFAILAVLPGKPAQVILGTQATPEAVKELTAQLGLDKPLWHQYLDWMHGLVTLHLGNSYISHMPIGHELDQALAVTLPLVGLGLLVGILLAVPFGTLAANQQGKRLGLLLSGSSQLGIAIPNFVTGVVLILIFAVKLGVLPASGFTTWSNDPLLALKSLVLPAITLGLVEGAILSRYVRSAVIDVQGSDYLRTARAKGFTRRRALRRHGTRNASIPLLTVLGLEIPSLIIGAVVVENVFTLPGIGTLLLQAAANRDLIVVQDITMLIVALVLVINFLIDVSYHVLDPRLGAQA